MLAIQLQLSDIVHLLNSMNNNDKIAPSSERATLEFIQQDLVQQISILEGEVLVLKILRAEHNDRVNYKKLQDEEKQAASDHELALRLARMSITKKPTMSSPSREAEHKVAENTEADRQWELAKQLYAFSFDGDDIHPTLMAETIQPIVADRAPLHGVRSVPAVEAGPRKSDPDPLTKCDVCMEELPPKTTLRLQCTHVYCRGCLLDLFTSAISETTLFPPRCCKQPIPLEI